MNLKLNLNIILQTYYGTLLFSDVCTHIQGLNVINNLQKQARHRKGMNTQSMVCVHNITRVI